MDLDLDPERREGPDEGDRARASCLALRAARIDARYGRTKI
jgi:hypothetical protein